MRSDEGGAMRQSLRFLLGVVGRAGMSLFARIGGMDRPNRLLRRAERTTMLGGLTALAQRGIVLRTVVDGGAFVGEWTKLCKSVFPDVEVLMVEPQPRHAEALRQLSGSFGPTVRFQSRLIGAQKRDAVDFVVLDDPGGGTGSSVLPESSNIPRHTIRLPMTTLDDLIAETHFPSPDLIKLDLQGYELEVLRGASAAVKAASFVLLEVSTWRYNAGAPLLHDVVAWMAEAGFVSYDLLGIHRRPDGVLLHLDILFVRSDSSLLDDPITIYSSFSRSES